MQFSLGHFKVKANAEAYRRKIEKIVGRDAKIIVEDNFLKSESLRSQNVLMLTRTLKYSERME